LKYLEERIRYFLEWIRLLWFAVIGLAGGMSGLILALDSPLRVGLLVVAGILEAVALFLVIWTHLAVLQMLRELKEKGP